MSCRGLTYPLKLDCISLPNHVPVTQMFFRVCMCARAKSCPTLCDPMGCSSPGSSVHGILQARILEWVAMSSPRGSSQPRDLTCVSFISCIGRQILYHSSHLGRPLNAPITSSLSTSAPSLLAAWECCSALGPHPRALIPWLTDCSPSFELVASSGHNSRGVMEGVGTSAVNLDVSSSFPLCLFPSSNKLPGPVFFIFFLSLIASVT